MFIKINNIILPISNILSIYRYGPFITCSYIKGEDLGSYQFESKGNAKEKFESILEELNQSK